MAYNFFESIVTDRRFPRSMKMRFGVIVSNMDDDYNLPSGKVREIITQIKKRDNKLRPSITSISADVSIISHVVQLIRNRGIPSGMSTNKRAESKALEIYSKLPKNISLENIQEHSAISVDVQDAQVGGINRTVHPLLGEANQHLVTLEEENDRLDSVISGIRREYAILEDQVKRLQRALQDVEAESEVAKQDSDPQRMEAIQVLYGLPEIATAKAFKNTKIVYTRPFLKCCRGMDSVMRKKTVKKVTELAKNGWKATRSSMQHEKLICEKKGIPAPKNSFLARINDNFRFLWGLEEGDGGSRHLVFYYVGKHNEVCASER